ncbi:MAG: FHA domain-containing protein [Bdellovibrionales bacterium]
MNQPSRFQIRIIGLDGERVERLHKVELVIGRSAQADIIVSNAEVSRKHVTMRVDGDQLLIVDEGSKNGTFLDGVRLPAQTPRVWRVGQSLKLGLAPEKLTLEPAVEQKEAPDAPPPVENATPARQVRRSKTPAPVTDRFSQTGTARFDAKQTGTNRLDLSKVSKQTGTEKLEGSRAAPITATERLDRSRVTGQFTSSTIARKGTLDKSVVTEKTAIDSKILKQEESIKKNKTLTDVKVKAQPVEEELDLDLDVEAVEDAPAAKSATQVGTSLLGDLEKRMQQVLARAEAEAKSLRENAVRESRNLQKSINQENSQVTAQNKTDQFEKAKLESQLRELKEEIAARSNERKNLAREHAETKLNLQNAQQELKRLESAKAQLTVQLNAEVGELEKKADGLQKQIEHESDGQKQRAQKEAREIIETAKKQADLLVSEAELKARNQREKMQSQISDQKRSTELDLADLKLRQVEELKIAQEKLEAEWQKSKQKTVGIFLSEVREKCEATVYGSQLDSGLKLRLLTALEESLHRHFATQVSENTGTKAKMPSPPMMTGKGTTEGEVTGTGTNLRSIHVSDDSLIKIKDVLPVEDQPLRLPRFNLRSSPMMAVFAVIAVAGGIWQISHKSDEQSQLASSGSAPVAPPAAAQPPPAVATAPPLVAAPATSAPAVPPPAAQPVAPQPMFNKTTSPTLPPAESITWVDVAMAKPSGVWQAAAIRYLETLNLDRRKIKRYQLLEQKFAREVSRQQGRGPASEREQRRLEMQFVRDANQILGAPIWGKLIVYRDYYWRKNN